MRILPFALVAAAVGLLFTPPAFPQAAADPNDAQAAVEFTIGWAAHLRGLRSFSELQEAIGARGQFVTDESRDGMRRDVFRWIDAAGRGRLQAFLYPDGAFAGAMFAAPTHDVVTFNSFGAYVCAACNPPADACGRRPSWIPRDLHWDNFDCENTMTGPQDWAPPQP